MCELLGADLIIKCDVQERILNTLLLPFYQSYVCTSLLVNYWQIE